MRTLCVIALTAATLTAMAVSPVLCFEVTRQRSFVDACDSNQSKPSMNSCGYPCGHRVRSPTPATMRRVIVLPIELKSLDGRTVKLSDFRGEAVVLNFWATYCSPCRVEMPWR